MKTAFPKRLIPVEVAPKARYNPGWKSNYESAESESWSSRIGIKKYRSLIKNTSRLPNNLSGKSLIEFGGFVQVFFPLLSKCCRCLQDTFRRNLVAGLTYYYSSHILLYVFFVKRSNCSTLYPLTFSSEMEQTKALDQNTSELIISSERVLISRIIIWYQTLV